MKKVIILLLSALLISSFAGCGNATERADDREGTAIPSGQLTENLAEQAEDITENPSEQSEENAMNIQNEAENSPLPLSEYYIKISADGNEAVFQLYDTAAAEKLYEQLPLTLDTENFRNAQWMFYPPEKLPVTSDEAYHDGIKGELSYYEPWGDVFILYEDFYAGDEMHRLGVCTSGMEVLDGFDESVTVERMEQSEPAGVL